MNDMKYRAVLWDVDGTLIDSAAAVYISQKDALTELKRPEWYEKVKALAMHCTSEALLRAAGFTDIAEPLACWNRHYAALSGSDIYRFCPGAEEAVRALRAAGIRQAIVTSRIDREVYDDLRLRPLLPCFDTIVTGDDTARHKPDPEPVLLCLERLGVRAEEAVYIGDTSSDEAAAKAAGVDFLYANENIFRDLTEKG